MDTQLAGGRTAKDPRLGRLPQFDDRSRQFPIRPLTVDAKPRSFTWSCNTWLNQGQTSACTGFAVTHEAAARPVVVPGLTEEIATAVYQRAKELDQYEGTDYEGSSVLGAVKAGKEKGWFNEYRWAFGLQDLILAIGHSGPAVIGVNWYAGMMDSDPAGLLIASGDLMGGHAVLLNGVSIKRGLFRGRNSWGIKWGANGDFYLSFSDVDRLLREEGEACIIMQRHQPLP